MNYKAQQVGVIIKYIQKTQFSHWLGWEQGKWSVIQRWQHWDLVFPRIQNLYLNRMWWGTNLSEHPAVRQSGAPTQGLVSWLLIFCWEAVELSPLLTSLSAPQSGHRDLDHQQQDFSVVINLHVLYHVRTPPKHQRSLDVIWEARSFQAKSSQHLKSRLKNNSHF